PFLVGTTALGLFDVVRVIVQVRRGVELYDTGNMRDPQMYMVSLCFLIALLIQQMGKRVNRLAAPALLVNLIGIVLHFKRGVWFAFALAAGVMGLLTRRLWIVVLIVLCAVSLLIIPQTRERLHMLKKEWSIGQEGRYALWTQVAPSLLREYPQGMGFGAVKHEDFLKYTRYVQPKLNHLHNNVLQVAVELGWAGLAVWMFWMSVALWMLYSAYDRARVGHDLMAWVALGAFGAFCGLMFDGMVEYNFGDSEILMLICYLMGLTSILWERQLDMERAGGS
ncbi:MAG: O-antigen ligase family protein, partial [Pseudomonadota bacterium]